MNSREFPKVNSDICSGCQECVNICPAEAIIIESGVARIIENNCRACYVCQSVCPMEAIY